MKIKKEKRNDVIVCTLAGEINIDTVPQLKIVFKDILDHKSRKVLLNFKEVEYIDSLGVASLIEFLKKMKDIDGTVFLSDMSPKVRTIFGIIKLENVFKIYNTEEEALREFGGY